MAEQPYLDLSEDLIQSVFETEMEADNLTGLFVESEYKNYSDITQLPEFKCEDNFTTDNFLLPTQRVKDYKQPSEKSPPSKWDVISLIFSSTAILGSISVIAWFIINAIRLAKMS